MSPAETEAWLRGHPGVVAYICVLLAGSIISSIILLNKVRKTHRLSRSPVTAWPLSNLDFGIFIIALILWFVLSGTLLMHLYSLLMGEDSLPGPDLAVLGGFLLQAGMLYLFFRFRFYHRSANEGPISPRIVSLGQSLLQGLFYFLASLPVVYGVSLAWNVLLEFLRSRGWELDLPLQDAVLILQEIQNPLTFFALLFLAVVMAPVVEETVFRAGVYRFFKGKMPMVLALVLSGGLFGMIHGNVQSLPGLVAVGICLGLAYEMSGSIRVPIFFHAFFNLNSILWILIIPEGLAG
ncbi:MAG: CPBP family intramembrane glutamic endopeptidase [Opitutales bacterium]|jgi:membrane protease YdiL (CAAX protease family)